MKKQYCLFCGDHIIPESSGSDIDKWLFECSCGAIYETIGKTIPTINVINRRHSPEPLYFDNE